MTPEQERILELEQSLADVLTNLQEDVPIDQWSKHLRMAVDDAFMLLGIEEAP